MQQRTLLALDDAVPNAHLRTRGKRGFVLRHDGEEICLVNQLARAEVRVQGEGEVGLVVGVVREALERDNLGVQGGFERETSWGTGERKGGDGGGERRAEGRQGIA